MPTFQLRVEAAIVMLIAGARGEGRRSDVDGVGPWRWPGRGAGGYASMRDASEKQG